MSLLLIQYDRHLERVVAAEPTELPLAHARRECMARNTNGHTRPAPRFVWQVRELGDISSPASSLNDLFAALQLSIDNQKARHMKVAS